VIATLVALLLAQGGNQPIQGKVEVLWLGQSAFRITTPGSKVIVIDPG
jgi:L-ascorbate metabolism protein UlaG (beta-lactamase superfamily)